MMASNNNYNLNRIIDIMQKNNKNNKVNPNI